MAASRLTDCQKSELLEGYRSGRTTKSLAEQFACSPITVNRTVKNLLQPAEYVALKAARARGDRLPINQNQVDSTGHISGETGQQGQKSRKSSINNKNLDRLISENDNSNQKAKEPKSDIQTTQVNLDNRKDADPDQEENSEYKVGANNESTLDIFHEVVPLANDFNPEDQKDIRTQPLSSDVLPDSVYMLVEKNVELDIKYLKDLSELGAIDPKDKDRQAICLFSNQRSAKRVCGRTQRVIKVPDSSVFEVSKHFLLAKGITRLVIEGSLISLDSE